MAEYPYFIYPLIHELEQCAAPERMSQLKRLIAANVGDRDALLTLIGTVDEDLRAFYPGKSRAKLSTDDTIDSFLARFGGNSRFQAHETLFPDAPLPAPEPSENTSDRADDPLPSKPSGNLSDQSDQSDKPTLPEPSEPLPEPPAADENPLERVKRLVKSHDYTQALEIMEAIYLNNPKKSVYFADQIRFIKKMMLNEGKKS